MKRKNLYNSTWSDEVSAVGEDEVKEVKTNRTKQNDFEPKKKKMKTHEYSHLLHSACDYNNLQGINVDKIEISNDVLPENSFNLSDASLKVIKMEQLNNNSKLISCQEIIQDSAEKKMNNELLQCHPLSFKVKDDISSHSYFFLPSPHDNTDALLSDTEKILNSAAVPDEAPQPFCGPSLDTSDKTCSKPSVEAFNYFDSKSGQADPVLSSIFSTAACDNSSNVNSCFTTLLSHEAVDRSPEEQDKGPAHAQLLHPDLQLSASLGDSDHALKAPLEGLVLPDGKQRSHANARERDRTHRLVNRTKLRAVNNLCM